MRSGSPPQRLRLEEINAVFRPFAADFAGIELKPHLV